MFDLNTNIWLSLFPNIYDFIASNLFYVSTWPFADLILKPLLLF